MSYTVDLSTVPTTELAAPAVGVVVLDQQGYGPPGPQGPPGPTGPAGGGANDALVVHLAGTETITGAKTFTANISAGLIRLKQNTPDWAFFNGNSAVLIQQTNPLDHSQSEIGFLDSSGATVAGIAVDTEHTTHYGAYRFMTQGPGGFTSRIIVNQVGLTLPDNHHLSFGGAGGTKIGTTAEERFAFHGNTPIARPAGTPAAAVDPATTMALVNDLRAKLIALGLIS